MSIVIIAFEGAPKVSEEAQKKEALLDARLEAKVKGAVVVPTFSDTCLTGLCLMQLIAVGFFPEL